MRRGMRRQKQRLVAAVKLCQTAECRRIHNTEHELHVLMTDHPVDLMQLITCLTAMSEACMYADCPVSVY